MKDIVVREVDENLWREFRAEVVRKGLKTGEALMEAIRLWLRIKS